MPKNGWDDAREADAAEIEAADALASYLDHREADPAADPAEYAPGDPSVARAFWQAVAAVGILRGPGVAGVASGAGDQVSADGESPRGRVTSDDSPAFPSRRIGSFDLIGILGQGGMGIVYRAVQENPRRQVALKVIRPGVFSPEMLKRFQHEAQILGRLQHPGIAQVYEAATADTGFGPQPFFAMELVNGLPLVSYAEERKLSIGDRLRLLASVCDAVQHAHQKGVIHRDLKPANILVAEDGQPKILDFGVARATDSDVQLTTLRTDVGQLVGTIPYMSPEQVGGLSQDLDTRSDIYSLGVIAYELLTGCLPYDIGNKAIPEAARIICDELPPPLSSTNRICRGDVETIVFKAMEKERARRYQSAGELASDIRRYLNGEPIHAKRTSVLYFLRCSLRRHRAVCASSAVLLAVTAGFVAVSWSQSARLAAERRRQLEQSELSLLVRAEYQTALDLIRRGVYLDEAESHLGNVLRRDPRFSAAYFERGHLKEQRTPSYKIVENSDLVQDVLADYEAAHETAGTQGHAQALLAAARLCERMSRYAGADSAWHERALALYWKASTAASGDIYSKIARAELLNIQKCHAEALEILKPICENPATAGFGEGWESLASVLMPGHGSPVADKEESAEAWRRACALDPQNAVNWLNLGYTLRQFGKFDEAFKAYRRAVEIDPHMPRARKNFGVVLGEARQWGPAAEETEAAYDLNPRDRIELAQDLVFFHSRLDARDKVIYWAKRCVELAPDSMGSQQTLVELLCDAGETEAALEAGRQAMEHAPTSARAWALYGQGLLAAAKLEEAEAACARGMRISEEGGEAVAEPVIALAQCYEKKGETERAVSLLRGVLADFPADPGPSLALAKILGQAGRTEDAETVLENALAVEMDEPDAWGEIARKIERMGHCGKALAAYEKGHDLYRQKPGNNRWGAEHLAWFLLTCPERQLRDPQRALAFFDFDVVNGMACYGAIADGHSLALLRTEHYDKAIPAIEHALALQGENADDFLWLSIAQAGLGRADHARVAYFKARVLVQEGGRRSKGTDEYLNDAEAALARLSAISATPAEAVGRSDKQPHSAE